ncbi:MAG: hypothetical protein KAQ62_15555, partial [Cyclobacteriaceae bacterium]|nr:hypothetical protein [Cyclobacteriaceae bacterium]
MGVRYMQDEEYLLRRQQIIGNEEILKDELEELYQSKANKKFPIVPFAPYVWIYHLGEKRFDSLKIENKIKKIEARSDRKKIKHQGKEKKIARIERSNSKKTEKKRRDLAEGNILMRWGEPVSVFDGEIIQKTQEQMKQYLQNRGFFNSSVEYKTEIRG